MGRQHSKPVKPVPEGDSFLSKDGPTVTNTTINIIERVLAKKLTVFEKQFTNMNQAIVSLHEKFNKINQSSAPCKQHACKENCTRTNDEEASNKKAILEMQNQIAQLAAKQSELDRKLASRSTEPQQDDAALKERLEAHSFQINHLVTSTSQIKGEMSHLKDIVESLSKPKADREDQRSLGASNWTISFEPSDSESVKMAEKDAEMFIPGSLRSNDSREAAWQSQKSLEGLLFENFQLKTGQEEEQHALFNERGKIFHFVKGEWRKRGTGKMQILMEKETNAFRLLMKRDETLDLICNHAIAEGLQLEPFQESNKTLTWIARDFSEQAKDGLVERFALKFKTEEQRRVFEGTVKDCIEKL